MEVIAVMAIMVVQAVPAVYSTVSRQAGQAVHGSLGCLKTHGGTVSCIGFVFMFQPSRPYGLGLGRGVL